MSREKIDEMATCINEVQEAGWKFMDDGQFTTDVYNTELAEHLYTAVYRKHEWISVEDRLPEDVYKDRKIITVIVCTKSGRVSTSSRVRMMMVNKEKMNYEYTDIFEWSGQIAKKVTHWMPLPEAPKMKGGAEV